MMIPNKLIKPENIKQSVLEPILDQDDSKNIPFQVRDYHKDVEAPIVCRQSNGDLILINSLEYSQEGYYEYALNLCGVNLNTKDPVKMNGSDFTFFTQAEMYTDVDASLLAEEFGKFKAHIYKEEQKSTDGLNIIPNVEKEFYEFSFMMPGATQAKMLNEVLDANFNKEVLKNSNIKDVSSEKMLKTDLIFNKSVQIENEKNLEIEEIEEEKGDTLDPVLD